MADESEAHASIHVPEQLELSAEDVKPAMEAILMATDEPLHAADFARVLGCPLDEATRLLAELADDYDAQGRGFELRHTARGWQYASRGKFESIVSHFVTDGQTAKLSQAALEALAIIAYKQPITRLEIEGIRGVASDYAVNKLLEYELICELGRKDAPGKPILFGTTEEFLRSFGVKSIKDLPKVDTVHIEEFKQEAEEEINLSLKV